MKIESLKPEDCARVAEIYNAANQPFLTIYSPEELKTYEGHLSETAESISEMAKRRMVIVARDDTNLVVGYAAFRVKNPDVVWLSSLFIDPNYQKKGIGEQLLKYVETFSKENKCQLVALETHKNASWAIQFYLKNNYQDVREKVSEYPYSMILEKAPVADRPLLAKKVF